MAGLMAGLVAAMLAAPGAALERLAPPNIAMPTPHGLVFEQMTLAPMRHADGRACWTLELHYASVLWAKATTDEGRQRVATELESDMDAIFGETRRAVVALSGSEMLPEVGAVLISIDEPGGRMHPHGAFTERSYYIGGDCR
jgi:hypothetical protein